MLRNTSHINLPGLRGILTGRSTPPAQYHGTWRLKTYAAEQVLRSSAASLDQLQVLLSGFAKTSMLSAMGEEHILGFAMPGDVLDLGGLACGPIRSETVFLTEAVIAELPLVEARSLEIYGDGFGGLMCDFISRELLRTQWRNRLVRYAGVNTRAAHFLLEFGQRFAAIDMPSHKYRLFMSRGDIATFLGMTQCTLSRALHILSKRELIFIEGRWIEIIDPLELGLA